ncbi:glycosyltransferase [Claveliimonas bilis]|uniref:Glycosyltransferase 2-like domain-containing protein n=1 Tax=Claveliimonas bilis TaxID=3028070 RepID=A0ABN6Z1V3_9FIRM|nr:glycosyltransferase [Claveliimonas bilis]BDZ77037.1 hypothetical protein Lac1_12200 [Claveliimonas bilis]
MYERIGFVILHYNAIKETIDCVNSIINNIDTDDYFIIVVDNKSPNNTGEDLKKRYAKNKKVKVILNKSNLGFAGGNNIGYQYAVEELLCSFVCILNNDTLIIQNDFLGTIKQEYQRSKFGVMGPMIILKKGEINNLYYSLPDLEFFKKEKKIMEKEYFIARFHLRIPNALFKMIKNVFCKIVRIKRVSRFHNYFTTAGLNNRHEDVILHGCCLIFSPLYIGAYKEAFNAKTFLYKEEELLYLRCRQKSLKTVYNPNLVIRHLEDASTNSVLESNNAKRVRWAKNQIDSLQVVIEEMENERL